MIIDDAQGAVLDPVAQGNHAAHPHSLLFRSGDLVPDPLARDLPFKLGGPFVDKSTAALCAVSLCQMAFSFRQIQYFVAAAENGALSRAAHELSISQSTVAEAIRELEGDLGFPLFERKAQGVELTFKGNQFLRHARKILADVAEARGAVRSDPASLARRLALGVTPLVAGYVLAEILARFRRAFPAVTVEIAEDGRGYLEHLPCKWRA
jgi:molybdenum-dependent DNA-binding transcriptional regulator ModE